MVFSFVCKRKNICAKRVRSEGARFARSNLTPTIKSFAELFQKRPFYLCNFPDKSKFETEHEKGDEGTCHALKEFQEEISFKGKINLFAKGYDLKMDAKP